MIGGPNDSVEVRTAIDHEPTEEDIMDAIAFAKRRYPDWQAKYAHIEQETFWTVDLKQ
jgi:hypothetical protein